MSDLIFEDFWKRYDEWVDRDEPDTDFRFCVMAWLYELDADPCYAATVQPQANAWMARIPAAEDDIWAVVCLYTIDEANGIVRCSSFITLPKPDTIDD